MDDLGRAQLDRNGSLPKVVSRTLGTPWIGSGPDGNWKHAFQLFGVSVFQARMVAVLYTLATLSVIY